jgi:hypothetical protein
MSPVRVGNLSISRRRGEVGSGAGWSGGRGRVESVLDFVLERWGCVEEEEVGNDEGLGGVDCAYKMYESHVAFVGAFDLDTLL